MALYLAKVPLLPKLSPPQVPPPNLQIFPPVEADNLSESCAANGVAREHLGSKQVTMIGMEV